MMKLLVLILVAAAVGALLAPSLVPALTWILAFASLMILGDLLFSSLQKYRDRHRES